MTISANQPDSPPRIAPEHLPGVVHVLQEQGAGDAARVRSPQF